VEGRKEGKKEGRKIFKEKDIQVFSCGTVLDIGT
jgi:hypothetical protein